MSVTVWGTQLDGNVRQWSNTQRRTGGILALDAAVVVLLAALLTYFVSGLLLTWLFWALVVILVLVLLFIIMLLFAKPRPIHAESHLGPGAPATLTEATAPEHASDALVAPGPEPAPESHAPTITLRCGDCGTIFDISDTGERPLYHACPGCGAEGVLKETPAHFAQTHGLGPAPASAPGSLDAPIRTRAAEVSVAPQPPAVRKLKLRCGNCKQVFSIEDTGERPLRRPCPYCARMGEIR